MDQKKRLVQSLLSKNLLLPPSLLSKFDDASIGKLIDRLEDQSLPPPASAVDLLQVLRPVSPVYPSVQSKPSIPSPISPIPLAQPHSQNAVSIRLDLNDDDRALRSSMEHGQFRVQVISDYREKPKKRELHDFVSFFNSRYSIIEKILRGRAELANVLSISRLAQKSGKDSVAIIGMVLDKAITPKSQSVIITVEDPTGIIQVLFSKKNMDVYNQAKDICEDEVIGIVGISAGASDKPLMFGNGIYLPDVPLTKELKKAPMDHPGYAAFITDIHVGSKQFMEENFLRFVQWIKGQAGSDAQRELASKINYLFVGGDLVDGVGIYPGQEDDLAIRDIYAQYQRIAELIGEIPDRIKIIMIPGNHDAMRLNEPQPSLYKDICKPVWDLKNAVLVSNPSTINIHSNDSFGGFDVLLYHGYSFDYYVARVESIRAGGGYERADLIMKYLLQRRHLAPAHTSTPYIPDSKKDPLVIEKVPDFFLTGHIHRTKVASYRNVSLINGGCWQDLTAFQVKTGHTPEPCRVSLMDLQTREVRLLRF